jgi:hypothetical protein
MIELPPENVVFVRAFLATTVDPVGVRGEAGDQWRGASWVAFQSCRSSARSFSTS